MPNPLTEELLTRSTELRSLQTERLKRQRAKIDLLTFASIIEIPNRRFDKYIKPVTDEERERFQFIPRIFGAHQVLWLEKLQEVADGKLKRLLGLMPPGSSKSLFTSVCFPTYFLGRNPGSKLIVTAYGSDLPKKFGRWARTIVLSDMYQRIFNCTLSDESGAVDEWALTNGSEWYAKGILAGITGQRADGIIWDDLVKGRDEADSKLVRDKTWDAYMNDLQTRRNSDETWEIGVNCLTGDTPVAMADGTRKCLCEIEIGDEILTWDNGKLVAKKVLNWKSQGNDDVLEIRTGGSKVKANSR